MIHMPRRSVTRFFIPLVDVMMLMFSIFLLMPIMKTKSEEASGEAGPKTAAELARANETLERELQRRLEELQKLQALMRPESELRKALEELDRLKKEKIKTLQQRLVIKVLEIDPANGALVFFEAGQPPKRHVLDSTEAAEDLIRRHKREAEPRELYYLFLFPRQDSAYPEDRQFERYKQWFKDVAYGIDRPSIGVK